MNLIGYIRVSTEGQQDGTSLSEQARKIQEWCERAGHNLTAIFWDADSGENIIGRKGFQAAIKFCLDDNQSDGMVVANFDRFSRSVLDSETVKRDFQKQDKLLKSVEQDFDIADMFGSFTFQVNQAAAELARKQILYRLHSNRMAKVRKGGWVGHRPPYGYIAVRNELVEDPTEQMVIRYIRRLYKWTRKDDLKPTSLYDIARALNKKIEEGDERFLPKNGKLPNKPRTRPYARKYTYLWTHVSVRRILILEDIYEHSETRKICRALASSTKNYKAS
jgi:site-specific DNA recombinase